MELYEDILEALSERALTLDDIAYECKTNLVLLKTRLQFMSKHNLIEEKCTNKKRFYGLTPRGETIHNTLVVARRLEKLKPKTSLDSGLEAFPAFTEDEPKSTHRKR